MMLEYQQQQQQQQAAGSERGDNGSMSPASVRTNWINVSTAPNVGYENDTSKLTLLFGVEGLMCQKSCGGTIENALRSLPFVTFAKASYNEKLAVVSVDSGKLDGNEGGLCDRIVECVEDVGFGCTPLSLNDPSWTAEAIASSWEVKEKARNHHEDDTETSHRLTSATSSSSISRSGIFASEKETSRALRNNSSNNNNKVTATIQVKGMSCATCAKRVDKAIREEDKRVVDVDLDDSHYLLPSLVITDVSVNISTGRVRITFADSPISADEECSSLPPTFLSYSTLKEMVMEKCINPIIKIGYQGEILFLSGYASKNDTSATPIDSDPHSNPEPLSLLDNARHMESVRQQECDSWLRLLTYSACLTTPIVALSMYRMYDKSSHSISYIIFTEWLMLSLASIVQVVIGRRYYIAAFRSFLYSKMLGMDSLVVLGSTSAYLYSVIVFSVQYHCFITTSYLDNTTITDSIQDNTAHTMMIHDECHSMNGSATEPTFETAAMLLTFVTLGKYLEAYAKGKTATALQTLMSLQPANAQRVVNSQCKSSDAVQNGNDPGYYDLSAIQTEDVSIEQIQVGDLVYVSPGSRIPSDGVLLATTRTSAAVFIDESMLTGEPFPVAKYPSDRVYGSCVNQLSPILVLVDATGSDTMLARIVYLIEEAQAARAPIQAHADTIAGIFVPIVMCLSALTFVGWIFFTKSSNSGAGPCFYQGMMCAISVLVIACPCALGLATPTAVMVGTGVGASNGVLIKGGVALEAAYHVDTIIFDKTGTLTSGQVVMSECVSLLGRKNDSTNSVHGDNQQILENLPLPVDLLQRKQKNTTGVLLWLAACAELHSEHPIARAIVNAARLALVVDDVACSSQGVQVSNFQLVPGEGVECLVSLEEWGERWVRVGCRSWVFDENNRESMNDCDINESSMRERGDKEASRLRHEGHIAVFVSVSDNFKSENESSLWTNTALEQTRPSLRRCLIGVLGVVDPLQREARSTVQALQLMGIEVWMCTGDHEITANAVASHVGIPESLVCAGVKPEGKAALVSRLQKRKVIRVDAEPDELEFRDNFSKRYSKVETSQKRSKTGKVAFVGDGINDAVALAQADVGIAIGTGTEVAMEAADMVLVKNSLHDVAVAIHLSRAVFRRIQLNFFFAMIYNVLALPFAAGAMYPLLQWTIPPAFAGLMMAFSSVCVVTSSLCLSGYRKPLITEEGIVFIRKRRFGCLDFLFRRGDRISEHSEIRDVDKCDELHLSMKGSHQCV